MTVYADPMQVRDPNREAAVCGTHPPPRPRPSSRPRSATARTASSTSRARPTGPRRAPAERNLPGFGFYPEERRFYPQGNLASQVLGYAGVDNRGLAGLELSLDKTLAGIPGRERIIKDPSGEVIDTVQSQSERDGNDVYLTLDHRSRRTPRRCSSRRSPKWHAQERDRGRARRAHGRRARDGDGAGLQRERVRVGLEAAPAQPRCHGYVRAGLDVQARHRRGRALAASGDAVDELRPAVLDPRRRPDHPRRRAARHRDDDRRPDPRALLERGRDHARRAPRAARARELDLALRLRAAERDRLPGREPRDRRSRRRTGRARRSGTSRSARGSRSRRSSSPPPTRRSRTAESG